VKNQSEFIKTGLVSVFLAFLVNVLNYLFSLYLGRVFTVSEFGEVTLLFSLMSIVAIPSGAIMMMVAREVASGTSRADVFSRNILYSVFLFLLVSLIGVFLSYPLAHAFEVSYLSLLLTFLCGALSYALAFFLGVFQGEEKIISLNLVSFFQAAVKVLLGALLIFFSFKINGPLLAILVGSLLPLLFFIYKNRNHLFTCKKEGEVERVSVTGFLNRSKSLMGMVVANLFLGLVLTLDIFAAKHFFDKELAGIYASVSTIAKIPFYIYLIVSQILFPKYIKLQKEGDVLYKKYFIYFMLFTFVGSFSASVFTWFWGAPLIKLFFGAKYLGAVAFLPGAFIFFQVVSLVTIYINFKVALNKLTFTDYVLCSIVYITSLYLFLTKVV
jgi:O-antigen/teichoic acid export membrane protein